MTRRHRGVRTPKQGVCQICHAILGDDAKTHVALCKSFLEFRIGLLPRVSSMLSKLGPSLLSSVQSRIEACDTLEKLQDYLRGLEVTHNFRANETIWKRFERLTNDIDRFEIATEQSSFDEFKEGLRERFNELCGERRGHKSAQFEATRNSTELSRVLHDSVTHLTDAGHEDADRARMMLAEIHRYIASHPDEKPPPASASLSSRPILQEAG